MRPLVKNQKKLPEYVADITWLGVRNCTTEVVKNDVVVRSREQRTSLSNEHSREMFGDLSDDEIAIKLPRSEK